MELKMVKAVVFDIDGTLVDSVDFHAEAWMRAFEKFGKKIPFKQVRQQIGKGGDQLMPVFFSKEELARFGEEMEEYRGELYKSQYLPRVRGFSGVRTLFERVISDGKKIALASSAKKEELKAYIRIAEIENLVDTSTSADDVERSKPHPDIFESALNSLGRPETSEVVVVGDTPYDSLAAGKIGLRTIGLLCGGFNESELREAGCIEIYEGPASLLANYEQSALVSR
jgi:HAD superfamily hydrolase (TIGR01549 family)